MQFRDGNEPPDAEWAVPVRVTHRVDDVFEHDQQGVGGGGLAHQVFNSSTEDT